MPAAVAYIGAAWGGLGGAILIMNATFIANVAIAFVGPALGQAVRRSAVRTQAGQRA